MLIRFVTWLLKHKKLSTKDRTVLLNALLTSIQAVPLRSLIQVEDRSVIVMGKPLNQEDIMLLRESAVNTLQSRARKVAHDQVRFAAIDKGYLKSYNQEDALFYKAALWFAQQEDDLLRDLANLHGQIVDEN